jgi:peptidoglycan/xylan/chitin deacetylase (PgdA/CDA1 family)
MKWAWLMAALLMPVSAHAWQVPILVYHRFAPQATDAMTVRTEAFQQQLLQIQAGGYRVIPLKRLVDHLLGLAPMPPAKSIVITADDDHESVYRVMAPLVLRMQLPVTLFIYPSAISNASYAMNWRELSELKASGCYDIQSHSYWHPNFFRERKRLDPAAYGRFVDFQLAHSKAVLEQKTGSRVDLLSWPFGLVDQDLEARARRAGYVAAFTLERRPVREGDDPMALPRFLITDAVGVKAFDAILHQADAQ